MVRSTGVTRMAMTLIRQEDRDRIDGYINLQLFCSIELSLLTITIMKSPIGTQSRTGETCPESGVWRAVATPSTTAPIAKGNRMPPYNGAAVTWRLVSYA